MVNRARYTTYALGYDNSSYFKYTIEFSPECDNYWGPIKRKLQN